VHPFTLFDIGTLLFAVAVTAFVATGLLAVFTVRHYREMKGLVCWTAAGVLLSASGPLFLMQHDRLDFVSIFLPNTFVLAGLFLVAVGLRRFHGRSLGRAGWAVLAAVGAVSGVLLYFVMTGWPGIEGRIAAVSAGIIAATGYMILSLPRSFVKTLAGGTIAGAAAALMGGAVIQVMNMLRRASDTTVASLVQLDTLSVAFLLVQMMASITLLFALVLVVPYWLTQKKEALAERVDLLYRELRHRVGNDLNVVLNYLEMAKQNGTDPDSQFALAQSQSMVGTISQMHAMLARRTDPEEALSLDEQLRTVARQVVDSFALPHIQLAVDVEPVHAEARTLKNCALMVNELLTNACKYAFPGQEAGALTVRLTRLDAPSAPTTQRIRVTVADDGVGLSAPWGSGRAQGTGFGQALVTALADDLDAAFDVQSDASGTRATWTFDAPVPAQGRPV